jgi:RNA polymerase sigma-70 factor (ECF subfamily)
MNENEWLAERFEENRGRLRAVAFRMLGSISEADDAVQEAWLRLSRADSGQVENLGGWMTTIVGRVCLDMLRRRKTRREDFISELGPIASHEPTIDPEQEAVLADSVGQALLVVLGTLAPAERLAFVLHDMFDVPFDEIASIVGRSPEATRKLASRARRRVQAVERVPNADHQRRKEIVDAFLAASRGGNFERLVALLDPDVVLRADQAAIAMGALGEVRGADKVAATFSGRAQAAAPALVDGAPALVWAVEGRPRVVFGFTITSWKIAAINLVGDPERLAQLDIAFVED